MMMLLPCKLPHCDRLTEIHPVCLWGDALRPYTSIFAAPKPGVSRCMCSPQGARLAVICRRTRNNQNHQGSALVWMLQVLLWMGQHGLFHSLDIWECVIAKSRDGISFNSVVKTRV